MPIITIKFNLPEEKDDLTLAQKGSEFYRVLFDLDQECRSYLKYGHELKFSTVGEILEWVREFIRENTDLECVE